MNLQEHRDLNAECAANDFMYALTEYVGCMIQAKADNCDCSDSLRLIEAEEHLKELLVEWRLR